MLLACGDRFDSVATLSRLCKFGEPGVCTFKLVEATSDEYVLSVNTEYTVASLSLNLCEPKSVNVYFLAGFSPWISKRARLSAAPGPAAKSIAASLTPKLPR